MQRRDLKSMTADQLWNLHEELVDELCRKIAAEKVVLEDRLHRLGASDDKLKVQHRPYPKVLPKYRNPKNPAETWAGRGRQPRWLRAQLQSGNKLDDFRIERLVDGQFERPSALKATEGSGER